HRPAAPPVAAAPAAPPPRQPVPNRMERDALAAIAAAVAPAEPAAIAPVAPASYGDVTVRPIAREPSLFAEPKVATVEMREGAPLRAPRMPNFEDLPMPAQAEIRQARGEAEPEHPQKTRLSLLQRLANVGLGRRDEATEPPIAARASGPAMERMAPLPQRRPP